MIISGLIVSVDAFFIGISFGLMKRFRFLWLMVINAFLFCLCIFGFFVAEQIYERIPFNTGLIVGGLFIGMGLWYIAQCFLFKKQAKSAVPVGIVMSVEAMIITMGLTFMFLPASSVIIPLVVAMAHFGYSAVAFFLARVKYVQRLPMALSHVISGAALVVYGVFALVL